jgi:hypothetical protein
MNFPLKGLQNLAFSCLLGLAAPSYSQQTLQDPVALARDMIDAGKGLEAKSLLLPLAGRESPEAAYWLGRLYYYDLAGIRKDYRRSAYWFARSAEVGHSGAQYKMGGMYFSGRGVSKDIRKAVLHWRAAALQRHPEALNNLGALLATGQGVGKNPDFALALQIVAADMGSEAAQGNVLTKGRQPAAAYMAERFVAEPEALDDRLNQITIEKP